MDAISVMPQKSDKRPYIILIVGIEKGLAVDIVWILFEYNWEYRCGSSPSITTRHLVVGLLQIIFTMDFSE